MRSAMAQTIIVPRGLHRTRNTLGASIPEQRNGFDPVMPTCSIHGRAVVIPWMCRSPPNAPEQGTVRRFSSTWPVFDLDLPAPWLTRDLVRLRQRPFSISPFYTSNASKPHIDAPIGVYSPDLRLYAAIPLYKYIALSSVTGFSKKYTGANGAWATK